MLTVSLGHEGKHSVRYKASPNHTVFMTRSAHVGCLVRVGFYHNSLDDNINHHETTATTTTTPTPTTTTTLTGKTITTAKSEFIAPLFTCHQKGRLHW